MSRRDWAKVTILELGGHIGRECFLRETVHDFKHELALCFAAQTVDTPIPIENS
jgi:hypothetical protein